MRTCSREVSPQLIKRIFNFLKEFQWPSRDLNPGPSACEADVIPLRHAPNAISHVAKDLAFFGQRPSEKDSGVEYEWAGWSQEINCLIP